MTSTDYFKTKEIDMPRTNKKWLECRTIFTKYEGLALAAKLGLIVYDDTNNVCQKKCSCDEGCGCGCK
jgi:hypothetical protein